MEMKNNNDTTREDIKHIIGACVCKNDDKTCWYTHNAQEVENDSTVQDNQVNAVLNLILQDRERAVREAKLEAGAKQAILDWHNKQIEEVLDRLEAEKLDLPTTPVDSHGYPQGGIQRIYPFIPLLAIEAERNKLKESN